MWTPYNGVGISTVGGRTGIEISASKTCIISSSFVIGGRNFSYEFWEYSKNRTIPGKLVVISSSSTNHIAYVDYNDIANTIRLAVCNVYNTDWVRANTPVVPLNTWCHIGVTYTHSSRVWEIFYNHKSAGKITKSWTAEDSTFIIGGGNSYTNKWRGLIDNFIFYNGIIVDFSNT